MKEYMPLIVAIVGSSGAWKFVEFCLDKKNKNHQVVKEIKNLYNILDSLKLTIDRNQAEQARIRILRFDDDITTKNYSQDFFRQTLADIKTYEDYCNKDKDFENGYTIAAANHIKKVYQEKLENNSFRKESG